MASNYPGSLDSFDTIASDKKTSDSVGGRTHRDMHNDLGDAIEAVQAELGTDPAGDYATVKARLDALAKDTGRRNVASLLVNGWTGTAELRRVGAFVTLFLSLNGASASNAVALTLPSGFTDQSNDTFPVPVSVGGASVGGAFQQGVIAWSDTVSLPTGSADVRLNVTFGTVDAWPSPLPGSAA